ncbi:MAG: caspase family protein [Polymorphobacter sp.]
MKLRLAAIGLFVGVAAGAQQPILPKIVLQNNDLIEVAAWTPDNRFIVTASAATHGVTTWDSQRRVIVDRFVLPSPADNGNDLTTLSSIAIAADGKTAIIRGRRVSRTEDGFMRPQDWLLDLRSRSAVAAPTVPGRDAPTDAALAEAATKLEALGETIDQDGETAAAAAAKLDPLPGSPDGRWSLQRQTGAPQPATADDGLAAEPTTRGLLLTGRDGSKRLIAANKTIDFDSVAVSPAGLTALLVESSAEGREQSRLTTYRLKDGGSPDSIIRPGTYGSAQWVDEDVVLVTHDDSEDSRDPAEEFATKKPSPPLVYTPESGAITALAPRCYVTLVKGVALSAGLSHCRAIKGDMAVRVSPLQAASEETVPVQLPRGAFIDRMIVSAAGDRLAYVFSLADSTTAIAVQDLATDKVMAQLVYPAGANVEAFGFVPGANTAFLTVNSQTMRWNLSAQAADGSSEAPAFIGVASVVPGFMVSNGRVVATSGVIDSEISRLDAATGKRLPPYRHSNAYAGGFLPADSLFWAWSGLDGLRVWDTRTDNALITTYIFPGDKFFAVTPEGRYDTNLPADSRQFRWLMPDAPWQSLGPQTFMRDYFEPDLTRRLFTCRAEKDCAAKFEPIKPLATLNRVLPIVTIDSVTAGPAPGTAIVTVSAREGTDPEAARAGRNPRSGLYNLRLFRTDQLVGQYPANPADTTSDTAWRSANRLPVGTDGIARTQFTIRLDTSSEDYAKAPVFTAYAFNEDRVKGETARRRYTRPPVPPQPRRAYVLTIGIDAYAESSLRLNYAAADAALIATELAKMPGRETRHLDLRADAGSNSATRALITAAFAILAGRDVAASRAALAAAGIDASGFAPATPDDAVIISYAGHGWAAPAPSREFFLLPSDVRLSASDASPLRDTMIPISDLTRWMLGIDAGEMALIIDACQSGASVQAGYKPGPMGDRGLGQLAYDKGIMILAATQADNVALEDGAIGHGLLTYALVRDGLARHSDGTLNADNNSDGTVTLDEWLAYPVDRLPVLAAEIKAGTRKLQASARMIGNINAPARAAKTTKIQQPALFNFTDYASPIVVRQGKGGRR